MTSSRTLVGATVVLVMAGILSAQTKIPMGINVDDQNYYGEPVFTNMMLNAEDWHLKNADGSGGYSSGCPRDSLKTDSAGYPLQIPQNVTGYAPQMVEAPLGWLYPAGRYVITWDGDGALMLGFWQNVSTSANRMVATRTAGAQTFITITRSTLGNHVRNIRVLPESMESAYDPAHPFLRSYLDVVSKFHCLRFMGWQGTNCSTQKYWSMRRLPDACTQATSSAKGPAIEMAVLMCNEANADMWFCVPHQADDDYLDKCAALIKSTLNPNLKLYIEYSNECWNWGGGFCQFGWINGNAGVGGCSGAADSISSAILQIWQNGGAHPETYGWLAARMFKHFRAVWTGTDQERLIRVVGGQAGWLDITNRSLTKVQALGGCDAVAVAPYFGLAGSASTLFCGMAAGSVTSGMILDSIDAQVTRDTTYLRQNGDIARNHGVPLIYYEAGPDFGYDNCTFTGAYGDSVKQANRRQAMYDVYVKAIRESLTPQVNCQLYVPLILFGNPEHYGHLDSSAQVAAFPFAELPPKWRALMDCNTAKAAIGVVSHALSQSHQPLVRTSTMVHAAIGTQWLRGLARAGTTVYSLDGQRLGRTSLTSASRQAAQGVYIVRQQIAEKRAEE
jgi:hypothetical protein